MSLTSRGRPAGPGRRPVRIGWQTKWGKTLGFRTHQEINDHVPRRGCKCSTDATWWIRQAITCTTADQARTIRIPVHMIVKIAKEPILMETPVGDDEDSHLGDFIEDSHNAAPVEAAMRASGTFLTVCRREAKVLRMRFGIEMSTDHTLEEVGKQFDVTRERSRQIEANHSQAETPEPLGQAAHLSRRRPSCARGTDGGGDRHLWPAR